MATKKYLDLEGLQAFKAKCDEAYSIHGALTYKGSVATVSSLPTVANANIGDMYNIEEAGTTTADFVVGLGGPVLAGDNVIAVNTAADGEPAVMKWDILSGLFDVSDRLQFGNAMPASPANGQTFLYLGNNTYDYTVVADPAVDANPAEEGWYEYDDVEQTYSLTEDTSLVDNKDYYTQSEGLVKGVIYVYNESGDTWVAQSSGDIMTAITNQEINGLFE